MPTYTYEIEKYEDVFEVNHEISFTRHYHPGRVDCGRNIHSRKIIHDTLYETL
jgi:hypothetical protein